MKTKIQRYVSENGTRYELKNHTLRVTGKYGYVVSDDCGNEDIYYYVDQHEEELRCLHADFIKYEL